jgi:hypothetical protein
MSITEFPTAFVAHLRKLENSSRILLRVKKRNDAQRRRCQIAVTAGQVNGCWHLIPDFQVITKLVEVLEQDIVLWHRWLMTHHAEKSKAPSNMPGSRHQSRNDYRRPP